MSGIVCAIRGGPDSQPAILKAIELAGDTGLPLHFLYVVNLDFLSHAASSRIHTISEEMRQMGEFILMAAQSTASARGVEAQTLIRSGSVTDEITHVCRELEASYLVLGAPGVGKEGNVFTREMLDRFVEETEQQTGAEVVLPERLDP